ncbi:MAG: LacI family DNA-binding transcriptional regulator, partial [Opitutaceae bacterium]
MKRRVTMAVIAKRAGVHTTTVSLALRNHPSLPQITRTRIQALAKEMGYQPDPALASLIAYRTQLHPAKNKVTLAYVTNWLSRWGWKKLRAQSRFFAGATTRAEALGFQIEHFWLGEEGLRHERLSDMLHARGITGVILASHRWNTGDVIRFDWRLFSAVKIDFFPHEPALHSVTNDQRAVMQLAMQRTIAAGYRRIGCVMPQWWDNVVDRA